MSLSQTVVNRISALDSASTYRGRITDVDTDSAAASVSVLGGTITSLQWLGDYVPAVDDRVMLLRDGNDWVILGELSTATVNPPVTATTVIPASLVWQGIREKSVEAGVDSWWWGTLPSGTYAPTASQGLLTYTDPYGHLNPDYSFTAYHWSKWYGALALYELPTLPSGAVVNAAKLRVTRQAGGVSLVSPVLYGHTLSGTPSGAVAGYLHASYGPWRPGSLAVGDVGRWDLPSGWLAAWLAGTVKGFGIWSDKAADLANFDPDTFAELTLTYTYTP